MDLKINVNNLDFNLYFFVSFLLPLYEIITIITHESFIHLHICIYFN